MAGRLLTAVPRHTADPTNSDWLQACYFVVLEHPLVCIDATLRGRITPLTEQFLRNVEGVSEPSDDTTNLKEEHVNGTGGSSVKEMRFVVITVDNVSGQLLHTGVPGKDLFMSMREAVSAIPALCPSTPEQYEVFTILEFVAFAGACLTEDRLYMLFVETGRLLTDDNSCIVTDSGSKPQRVLPVISVERARWYTVPLRVAVPALQQPLGGEDLQSWVLGPSGGLRDDSAMAMSSSFRQSYLFFTPGIDVSHCSIFEEATRVCGARSDEESGDVGNSSPNVCPGGLDGSTDSSALAARVMSFLPLPPPSTGREALGRCDCLWNEELIAFCDIFGLADCCCRLALGSFNTSTLVVPQTAPHVALLLVRLSRLALPGCFNDCSGKSAKTAFQMREYTSAHEAEFQLLLLPDMKLHDSKVDDNLVNSLPSLIWRRGGDFAGHEDIIQQKQRIDFCTARGMDPLPIGEDYVAAIFSSYQQRYGMGTKIALMHAGCWALIGSAPPHNTTKGGAAVNTSVNGSRESSKRRTDSQRGLTPASCYSVYASETHHCDAITNELQGRLQSLASHIKSHSLRPAVFVGAINSWATCLHCVPEKGSAVDALWSRECIRSYNGISCGGTTAGSSGVPGPIIPRICVSNSGEVSAAASAVVSLILVTVWLFNQFFESQPNAKLLQRHKLLTRKIMDLVVNSAAGLKQVGDSCGHEEMITLLRECLFQVVGAVPVSCTLTIWETARNMVFLYRANGDRSSPSDFTSTKKGIFRPSVVSRRVILNNPFHSFIMNLFPPAGGFYQREFARHRTRLLTHVAGQSYIIGAQFMFHTAESDTSSRVVSEANADWGGNERTTFASRQRYLSNPPLSDDDEATSSYSTNTSGVPTPTLRMLQGLVHPLSQPLLVPLRIAAVELTIALPTVSYITHVAIRVADALQREPFAGALTLSLHSSCYVGQEHERLVLDDVPLPLCRGSNASAHAGPHLIFYELPRPSCESVPFSVLNEARVVADGATSTFSPIVPVVARFLRYTLRGSGRNALAVFPLLVFGEPLCDIPPLERKTIVGRSCLKQCSLLRELSTAKLHTDSNESSLFQMPLDGAAENCSFRSEESINGKTNIDETTNTVVTPIKGNKSSTASHHDILITEQTLRELYVRKLRSACPRGVFALNLPLLFHMESKRLQCKQKRFFRDFCFQKLGLPLWVMKPSSQIFPHSSVCPSRVPESFEDLSRVHLLQQSGTCQPPRNDRPIRGANATQRKNVTCAGCDQRFMFGFGLEVCDRCKRHICGECRSKEPVRLLDVGISSTISSVCRRCLDRVDKLENALVAYNVTTKECEEVDSDTERGAAFEFYIPVTPPSPAEFPIPYSNYSFYALRGSTYQLTALPFTRVVSAPITEDKSASLFEEVLSFPADVSDSLGGWRCVSNDMPGETQKYVNENVVILLPYRCVVSHGLLYYTLAGEIRGSIDLQMHVGETVQTVSRPDAAKSSEGTACARISDCMSGEIGVAELRFRHAASDGESASDGSSYSLTVRNPVGILVSLFFAGSSSDLALLHVKHFSVWGCFDSCTRNVRSLFYNCPPDVCRYESLKLTSLKGVCAPPAAACLPLTIPERHLIKPGNIIHRLHTDHLLVEYVFSNPVSVCGFTVEGQHPASVSSSRGALPTALRLIGILENGFRGNIGYFSLPWPPLAQRVGRCTEREVFGYSYALSSTVHGLVSLLVEVAEWRLAKGRVRQEVGRGVFCNLSPFYDECESTNKEAEMSPQQPEMHLGKMVFWTSLNPEARHAVSSNAYNSIFSRAIGL